MLDSIQRQRIVVHLLVRRAVHLPCDVMPDIWRELLTGELGLYPRAGTLIPNIPTAGCVHALRTEHVFHPADKLKHVVLQSLSAQGFIVQIHPKIPSEVGCPILSAQLLPEKHIGIRQASRDVELSTVSVSGRSGLEGSHPVDVSVVRATSTIRTRTPARTIIVDIGIDFLVALCLGGSIEKSDQKQQHETRFHGRFS